jgi:hypothetical protein
MYLYLTAKIGKIPEKAKANDNIPNPSAPRDLAI